MAHPGKPSAPHAIPPRLGRWLVEAGGAVVLVGSTCRACGERFFPALEECGHCGAGEMDEIRLTGPATLFSSTVVHQLPDGFSPPLAVGYAELPGGVLVLAPIDATGEALVPGMRLAIHEGVTRTDENGEPVRTYRFRPAAG